MYACIKKIQFLLLVLLLPNGERKREREVTKIDKMPRMCCIDARAKTADTQRKARHTLEMGDDDYVDNDQTLW